MKRILPLSLAALLSVALFSSCAYDPLSEGYGTAYSSTSYHGGYYDGVYSDFYVGFSNNHYRYRHTRCSHCNHYPCRGGHSTNYGSYYRNYSSPLHGHERGHGNQHAVTPRSHSSSYPRTRTGTNYGHLGRFSAPVQSGPEHSSSSRTLRNPPSYQSSPRHSAPRSSSPRSSSPRSPSPRSSSPRGSRNSGNAQPSGNSRPNPTALTSTRSPRPTRKPSSPPPQPSKAAPTHSNSPTKSYNRSRAGVSQQARKYQR
jgi:hypothetical protein